MSWQNSKSEKLGSITELTENIDFLRAFLKNGAIRTETQLSTIPVLQINSLKPG